LVLSRYQNKGGLCHGNKMTNGSWATKLSQCKRFLTLATDFRPWSSNMQSGCISNFLSAIEMLKICWRNEGLMSLMKVLSG